MQAKLRSVLLKKGSPFALYCVFAGGIALLGSFIILAFIYLIDSLFNFGWGPSNEAEAVVTFADFFGYIILAPVIETFILGFFIRLLLRTKLTHLWICIVSAIGWGALHALVETVNFLVQFGAFLFLVIVI
ncbi:hypothetical protein NQT69_17765 [Pseudoalteromonas shioyasakiensis]|uniref:hypothetical protein n=1 Tax=Pseudoalteromonas shioyasakiensis TaxID=1190813 RepID=UPI00211807E1|nr:hypothetical protein [Pseudoalteromonas shioyasakiensis]MCQ8879848.1 hypothetical protein [Pseudoalteromonas shioyasakiensis]